MTERVVVETKCPQCGAPLDFSESSHAVRCGHCRTALLVTGRNQLLSFWIRPRVEEATAIADATPGRPGPSTRAQLVFLPYYRFTAHDLVWRSRRGGVQRVVAPGSLPVTPEFTTRPDPVADPEVERLAESIGGLFELFGRVVERIEDAAARIVGDAVPPPRPPPSPAAGFDAIYGGPREVLAWDDVELGGRNIERNFLAMTASRPALFSIGVRASVLRLELFHRETVRELGAIAHPTLAPAEALEQGLRVRGSEPLFRTTVAKALSLIWFPYWFVGEEGAPQTIVDAVAGGIVDRGFPSDVLRELQAGTDLQPATVGFRPLTCPNCGWDLPLREDDTVFFCDSCGRAWQLEKSDLQDVDAEFADVPAEGVQETVYLPFWTVTGRAAEGDKRYFVPAFAYRGLEAVHKLAWTITERQPEWERTTEVPRGDKVGCLYDRADGVRIANFLHVRSQMRQGESLEDFGGLSARRVVLTWLPFERRGELLFDPITGANLYVNLVG